MSEFGRLLGTRFCSRCNKGWLGDEDSVCPNCWGREHLAKPDVNLDAAVSSPGVKDDMVNHPPHYTKHPSGVECIQVTEYMNFCLGNVIKYVWRARDKGGIEDLKKARWYLDREISRVEGQAKKG